MSPHQDNEYSPGEDDDDSPEVSVKFSAGFLLVTDDDCYQDDYRDLHQVLKACEVSLE